MLNYSGKIDIVFPEKGKTYDIIESSGNIRKNLVFQGWSNGVSKPQQIFATENGKRVLINPSYITEMEEYDSVNP